MLTRKYYITPTLIIVVLNEGERLLEGSGQWGGGGFNPEEENGGNPENPTEDLFHSKQGVYSSDILNFDDSEEDYFR